MMISKVRNTVERYGMLEKGQTILVALSGGADSVALLSVLHNLQEEYQLHLVAAHVNHGIRGQEADRDEAFCKELCQSFGVPLRVHHADVPTLAKEWGISEETCGRKVRYGFFSDLLTELEQTASLQGKVRIATAHTAQDAVETFLFHLARGTGLSGLVGIPAVRGNLIRPLIDCTRQDIEAYLLKEGLSHVDDSSNENLAYTRNRIRKEMLPQLEAVNPGAFQNVLRCMELLATDETYLSEQAEAHLTAAKQEDGTYQADILANAHPAIVNRAVAKLLAEYVPQDVEAKHIAAVAELLSTGGQVQIPTGLYVRVRNNKVAVLRHLPEEKSLPVFAVKGAEEVLLPVGTFSYRVYKNPAVGSRPDSQSPTYADLLDYDKVGSHFVLRSRREGDRFSPAFRKLSKSLKALLTEAGLSFEERAALVLLEQNGQIAWCSAFGPAEEYRVTEETKHIMEITIQS